MRWYSSVVLVLGGALMAGSLLAQQSGLILRAEPSLPAPDFDGDLAKLAAASPTQPVSLAVEFVPTTRIEALADLIFAERVTVFSVYITTHASKKKRYVHGYSFSILGPAREAQVARARCQEQVPFLMEDPGPDGPLEPAEPRVSMVASVIVPAAQAQRWMQTHPAGVINVEKPHLVRQDALPGHEQIMRNVLTLQMPVFDVTRLPAGCEQYLSIRG